MKYEKESGIVRDAKGEIVARVSSTDGKTDDPMKLVVDFARPVTAAEIEEVFGAVTSVKFKAV